MRSKYRAGATLIHWAKGNRIFRTNEFTAYCSVGKVKEDQLNGLTYSLKDITCKPCIEKYIEAKEKEMEIAKEYLKYAR